MAIYLHAAEPPGGRPDISPIARERLYRACYRGDEPAELLSRADREDLVYDLWSKGWSDVEIAAHTRMTTYTTGRIRDRLGLAPHRPRKEAAA